MFRKIVSFISGSEAAKSLIRHGVTILGALLASKGIMSEAVAVWLLGAIIALVPTAIGVYDEWKNAGWRDAVASIIRHGGGFVGILALKLGWVPESFDPQQITGIALVIFMALWGSADEDAAQRNARQTAD